MSQYDMSPIHSGSINLFKRALLRFQDANLVLNMEQVIASNGFWGFFGNVFGDVISVGFHQPPKPILVGGFKPSEKYVRRLG